MNIPEKELLNYCIEKYRDSCVELRIFMRNKKDYPDGTLIHTTSQKKCANKTYFFPAVYLDKIVYTNNERRINRIYIKKSETEAYENLINERKEKENIQKNLEVNEKYWLMRLQKYIKKHEIDINMLNIEIDELANQTIESIDHRNLKYDKNAKDFNYKYLTTNGDLVKSKNDMFTPSLIQCRTSDIII